VSGAEPIVNIVRLPDGRIAAENARDQSELTKEELREIPRALHLWWSLMWASHFPGETPEANLP
jgi:hypothetical protein